MIERPGDSVSTAKVQRWCERWVGEREEARELAQDVWVVVCQAEITSIGAMGPWMRGVARNLCRAWRRKKRPSTDPSDGAWIERVVDTHSPDPEEVVAFGSLYRRVEEALRARPSREARAFWMRVDGHSQEEIREALGLRGSGDVRALLQRVRRHVRAQLALVPPP